MKEIIQTNCVFAYNFVFIKNYCLSALPIFIPNVPDSKLTKIYGTFQKPKKCYKENKVVIRTNHIVTQGLWNRNCCFFPHFINTSSYYCYLASTSCKKIVYLTEIEKNKGMILKAQKMLQTFLMAYALLFSTVQAVFFLSLSVF
jgi:hypothetical protein